MASGAPSCEGCGSMTYSQEWERAFGVLLCVACKRETPLLSKGAAKATYLLTDADLQPLGFISRSNPQHKNWSAMKMYLQEQVEAVAITKHGSLEALLDLRQQRTSQRLQGKAAKRQRETEQEEERERQLERLQAAAQARVEQQLKEAGRVEPAEDVVDVESGRVTRRYGPDMAELEGEQI